MKKMESYDNAHEATADLPFGTFANETSAGSDDGTEIVAEHMQDLFYALYQVLQLAGVQPNGSLENGNQQKQFLSALSNITPVLYNATTTYNKNVLTIYIYNNEISIYKSLKANNTAGLSDTTAWLLLAKINSSGIFTNMNLYSPALTGTPTAPTPANSTNNTQIATTAFVHALMNLIKFSPDYNSAEAIGMPYTATKKGFVYAHCYTGDGDNGFTVNNKWVVRHRSSQYGGIGTYIGGMFPVNVGDVVRCTGSFSDANFYPLI